MDKHSKAFLVLQEMRDESHRFAIQAQRKKKERQYLNQNWIQLKVLELF